MKKVMLVFGTRPEAIKMCPLVKELKKRGIFEVKILVTGQHKEMLDQVLDVFELKADYNLNIMKDKQSLFDVSINILERIKPILEKEMADIVLVHGDTSTSFVAGLSAFYLGIPVGHVEAGLRTYNKYSPYPEEFNRQAIGSLSDFHFAPTKKSYDNLIKEGKDEKKVFVTGNTVIDALATTVRDDYENENIPENSRMILLTMHRRENLGQAMRNSFRAIKRIVDDNEDISLVYPIHKNPLVREIAGEVFDKNPRIKLIEPLNVIDFHNFMKKAYLVMTDSGGIQEEAPALGKPVLVLRDTTERPEGVEAGTLKLVGLDEDEIYRQTSLILNDKKEYDKMSKATNPYGDGHASERICDILEENL